MILRAKIFFLRHFVSVEKNLKIYREKDRLIFHFNLITLSWKFTRAKRRIKYFSSNFSSRNYT